jgi:hypothetical protein
VTEARRGVLHGGPLDLLRLDQTQSVLQHVKRQGERFSVQNYMDGIRTVVARFLEQRGKGAA